jgi:molybdenum cofactor synthesis domain-containing protein
MATTMRPIRDTVPFDEAVARILEHTPPIERTERVGLDVAMGRVLAGSITSQSDVPPFDRAAMDGYAVVAEDTFGAGRYAPRSLTCVETVYTGAVPTRALASGQCSQIATGAPMPDGASAVVMVEETERDADTVRIFTPVYPGQHIGRKGADIGVGRAVLSAGTVLNPSRIGALAALGLLDVDVYAQPRVSVLSTGDEIVEPGRPLEPGQIYDINRFTLGSIIPLHGGTVSRHPTALDDLDALSDALDACLTDGDLVVFSGGSSVGERDLILDALTAKGEVLFHGIAVKPGKPTVFGRVGRTPVLGMPGYPTSCLSNAYLLLVPMLRHMARLPRHQPVTRTLPVGQRIVSTTGRHQFYTVRIENGLAVPAFKASGDITSMSQADGYIEIPAQTDLVEKGETVDVKQF